MNLSIENGARNAGWSNAEEESLFAQVHKARETGMPLKSVFEEVARITGRKPNSVRNYYYARVKEDGARETGHACSAFVPFGEDEVRALMRHVLSEQAKGVSVRACTLEMGGGDNKAMLRFQNKYRSVVKNDPELVNSVLSELAEEGITAFDPYRSANVRRVGRPRKHCENVVDSISSALRELSGIEDVDVSSFFEGLFALAKSARVGAESEKKLRELLDSDDAELLRQKETCIELRESLRRRENELYMQHDRFGALLSMFRQLVSVNRSFLCMNGVSKMSSLSNYVRELARSVDDCEKLVGKIAGGDA